MRSRRPLLFALVTAALLVWGVLVPASGQAGAGAMYVNTDYELFGTTQLTGGGHVTWTLTGAQAIGLRDRIIEMYDGYSVVPRGFRYGGDPTQSNHDGALQVAEGFAYTDRLENELEGVLNGTSGSQVGYFHLDRSDLYDKDPTSGFQVSTSGLVGANVNSTADLAIKFLFNGYASVPDVQMPLATRVYADALFRVFSFEADQSPTFTAVSGYSPAWPLLLGNGWSQVHFNNTYAMYAGNYTSCVSSNYTACHYDPLTDASSLSSIDSVNGAPGLDLRYATSAWVTFNYTGRVTSSGDALVVEAAHAPAYTDWAPLPNGTLSQASGTAPGAWKTVRADLSSYLGRLVRLRVRFTTGPAGTGLGFFLKDFGIHAPAAYLGPLVQNDAHYIIGLLSFSNVNVPNGGTQIVRTPGGELLFGSLSWDTTGAPPPDSLRFAVFDAPESPQILFAIMFVAAYLISWLQDSAYDAYRDAHPSVFRAAVHKATWLHWVGRAAIVVLILFYFVPTVFFAVGVRLYVSGVAYWFLALTLTLGVGLGTRAYYKQRLEESPPPAGPEEAAPAVTPAQPEAEPGEPKPLVHCTHCLRPIPEGETTYKCACGAVYHIGCASGLLRCSTCGKPIALEVVRDKRAVSMRCASCGEVQSVPEGVDPRAVTCASCGGTLRPLDAGKRYLLLAANPAIAFNWLKDLTKGSKPALCFTTSAPERLRLEFGLKAVTFVQVSSQATGGLNPHKLDSAGLKPILPLAREGKGGVLLYDALDQIVSQATLGDVVRFLRKANDMAFVHGITVIGRVGPGVLSDEEVHRLAEEFDELLDLSARL